MGRTRWNEEITQNGELNIFAGSSLMYSDHVIFLFFAESALICSSSRERSDNDGAESDEHSCDSGTLRLALPEHPRSSGGQTSGRELLCHVV